MEDIIKYFRYAMLLPVVTTTLVAIIFVALIQGGNRSVMYGTNGYFFSSGFIWPTPNYTRISSPFGRRNSPTKSASSYHQGIDIAANQGSNVLAISSGTVTFAGWSSSGGYMIIIEHANNYDSRYCHLGENLLVTAGQKVYAGQTIATVGPKYVSGGRLNGATTGVHLHLGIRKDGKFINPLQFFNL